MATTWSAPDIYTAKAICTASTGTESAPSAATEGMDGRLIYGLTPSVVATDGTTVLAAGTLDAYVYDPVMARWNYSTNLTRAVAGGSVGEVCESVAMIPCQRVAYVPNGLGTPVTITMLGSGR